MAAGRLARAAMVAAFVAVLVARETTAATPKPITIAVDPIAGAPGQVVAISGGGYASGTTYGMCILPAGKTKCGYEGANLVGGVTAEQFAAAADGTIPAGTTAVIPDLLAGAYRIVSTAPGTGAIAASTPFTVTAPTLSISPTSGAAGTVATLTLGGGAPNTSYTVCAVPADQAACGYVGIALGNVTTDSAGAFPSGTTVKVPGQLAATYHVGVFLANSNPTLIAFAEFAETAPTLTLSGSTGQAGAVLTAAGAGYAPGGVYTICLAGAADASCGGGMNLVGFTADPSGSIPAGVAVTLPARDPGAYRIGVVLDQSTPWYLAFVPFQVAAGTAPPATSAPAETTAATAPATAAPAPSAAPARTESGSGGVPLVVIAILLLLALALAFWFARRRREPAKPAS